MIEEKTITEEEAHTNEENFLRGYQQGLDDATTLHIPEESGC